LVRKYKLYNTKFRYSECNGINYTHYNLEEIEYVFKNYKKFEIKRKLKEINKKNK